MFLVLLFLLFTPAFPYTRGSSWCPWITEILSPESFVLLTQIFPKQKLTFLHSAVTASFSMCVLTRCLVSPTRLHPVKCLPHEAFSTLALMLKSYLHGPNHGSLGAPQSGPNLSLNLLFLSSSSPYFTRIPVLHPALYHPRFSDHTI